VDRAIMIALNRRVPLKPSTLPAALVLCLQLRGPLAVYGCGQDAVGWGVSGKRRLWNQCLPGIPSLSLDRL